MVPVVLGQDANQAEHLLAGLGLGSCPLQVGDPRSISAIVANQDPPGGTYGAPGHLGHGPDDGDRPPCDAPSRAAPRSPTTSSSKSGRSPPWAAADIDFVLNADEQLRAAVAGRAALDRIDVAIQACGRS